MKKKLFAVLLSLIGALCLALGLAACNTSGGNDNGDIAGTYYLYEDGQYTSNYIKLNGDGTTEASDGSSAYRGEYTTSGTRITLTYYNDEQPEGTETQTISGTVSDGVITIVISGGFVGDGGSDSSILGGGIGSTGGQGIKIYFCKKGKKPSSTPDIKPSDPVDDNTTVVDGITYRLSSDKTSYSVERCDEYKSSDLVILAEIDGKPVTSIVLRAFSGCSRLSSIKIPNSVTSIGEGAFAFCEFLTNIEIPESVTSIGDGAFEDCSLLTRINYMGNIADWCGIIGLGNLMTNGRTLYINNEELTGELVIPDGVTSIGEDAFAYCNLLTSITIPNGVTSIGEGAFYGCSALKTITVDENNAVYASQDGILYNKAKTEFVHIPNSIKGEIAIPYGVTSIGWDAFSGCSGLTSITIPDNVTSIRYAAFEGCDGLESITLPFIGETKDGTNNTHFGYIFGARSYGYNSLYVPTSLKTVVLTSGESIGSQAFRGCSSLTSITIPDSLTSIGWDAFYGCNSLTSIKIPDSVTSIGSSAFYGCPIESATMPAMAIDYIPQTNLKTVVLTSGESIESQAFRGCSSLTSITIPDSVTRIGREAFGGCSSLTSITIPDSVTSIGSYAFSGCSGLTSITIPDSVTSIGDDAFYACSLLKTVNITNIAAWCSISFGNIWSNPIYYAENLYLNGEFVTELAIPDGVTSIGDFAFPYGSLMSLTIPDSVTSIGIQAFSYCSSLMGIIIPDSVTSIGNGAFNGCSSLTSIIIPDSVTRIGSYAFYNCSLLASITLPFTGESKDGTENTHFGYIFGASGYSYNGDNVPLSLKDVAITGGSSVGNLAFYGCTSLTSITIPDTVTSIGWGAFYNCSSLTSATIPDGVTSIGDEAFYNCSGLTSITISDSMISIGDDAFRGCSGLTDIYYAGDVAGWCSISGLDNLMSSGRTLYINNEELAGGLVIPDGVTSIESSAFAYCKLLTGITIPDTVTGIGSGAFFGCTSLESITLPFVGGSVKTASQTYQYPFGYIFGTSSYTGGTATTQHYHGRSISGTTNDTYYIPSTLKSVTITGGNILYGAFYGCSGLTSITIPNSVTSIGECAFIGCSSLTSITIPDGVTSIGDNAFRNCSGLTSIYYTGDVAGWCGITGLDNIMSSGRTLYINNEELTGELVIPEGVTKISGSAFAYCSSLTSIIIPDGVTSIESGAFSGCNSIESATMPAMAIGYIPKTNLKTVVITSGKEIGDNAFRYCSSLTSITIPNSVTSIGYQAFYSSGLTNIYYAGDVAGWCSISWLNNLMNYGGSSKSLYLNETLVTELIIPDTVAVIPGSAFYGCSSLTSITLPDSVTSIGSSAFEGCSSLTSITIPDSVTDIGGGAFFGCNSIESATIPAIAIASIPKTNLKTVIITSGESIGDYVFEDCSSLTSITIPDSVNKIGNYAFSGCNSLTNIIIGNGVMSIGEYAFSGCSSLTSVTIGNNVTSVGSDAFRYCSSLTNIYYTGDVAGWCGITGLGNLMSSGHILYINNEELTGELVIPEGVTSIGEFAFRGCYRLTNIIVPNSVTSIGSSVFSGCSALESITLPFTGGSANAESASASNLFGFIFGTESYSGGTETTQRYAGNYEGTVYYGVTYYLPSALKSVKITCGNILADAFSNCNSLISISIGSDVTSIGDRTFYGCDKLVEVYNMSSLNITKGSKDNGYIGYYALNVYSPVAGQSKLTTTADGCIFYEDEATVYLVGYKGTQAGLTLPDKFNGKNYSIYQYAFSGCSGLTSITIGKGVKSIGSYAFLGCSGLISITIPDSVTNIGGGAFSGCISLTSAIIPEGITSIGYEMFYGCNSLKSVTIPKGVTSIGYQAFYGCHSLMNVTIPDSVENIEYMAFFDCRSLEAVYITNLTAWCRVSFGGNGANPLYHAYNLYLNGELVTKLVVPDGVTSIGDRAFENCSSLTSITIPDSVTSIGGGAFYGCSGLTNITLPDSVTSIGGSAFAYCCGLTSVTIGNSVTNIEDYAFEKCSSLTSITIPDGVTSIGSYAFCDCSGLTSVTIGNSVTSIGSYAFSGCYKLVEVYNLSSLIITPGSTDNGAVGYYARTIYSSAESQGMLTTTADGYIFYEDGETVYLMGYSGTQTELTLPDKFNGKNYEIYQYAFYDCNSLTSITIPDGVTSIGSSAFYGCSGLTNVTIGNGVTSIGSSAFYGCSGLTNVTIGNGVMSIDNYAFYNCRSLTSITIPDGVTSIGSSAFRNCNGLTSVTIGDSVTSIGNSAFYSCYKLVEVYNLSSLIIIPESIGNGAVGYYARTIYSSADEQSKLSTTENGYIFYEDGETVYLMGYNGKQTEITLPEKFNGKNYEIYQYAFADCSSLTSITIPDSVTSIGGAAFFNCKSLTAVYYTGTAEEWSNIDIDSSNSSITSATLYYYSESNPFEGENAVTSGNYWHYDTDGVTPVIWAKEN